MDPDVRTVLQKTMAPKATILGKLARMFEDEREAMFHTGDAKG
jgi:hypothetical protein